MGDLGFLPEGEVRFVAACFSAGAIVALAFWILAAVCLGESCSLALRDAYWQVVLLGSVAAGAVTWSLYPRSGGRNVR